MRRHWLIWLAAVVAAAGLSAYANRQAVLTRVAQRLIADEPRVAADAIVVISGSVPDRMLEGVALYRAGLAPLIVLTRESEPPGMAALRSLGGDIPSSHGLNISIATQLGVPRSAIITADGIASSTRREASLIVDFLQQAGIRRALLVTSKLHSYRAGLTFRAIGGARVQFVVCASRYDPFDPASWWRDRMQARRVVFEYQKLMLFQLWERWRGL
ncbi:MAG: YdcF family protein [Deltaproteobacteria bacterium]|nr:YdcF family protein [Deltaproteobacteria bacterium]